MLTEKQSEALTTIGREFATAFERIAEARRKFLRAGVTALGPRASA